MRNRSCPAGVVVSTPSVRLMKSIPSALNSSKLSIRCFKERAKRSNFQTKTTSNKRLRAHPASVLAGKRFARYCEYTDAGVSGTQRHRPQLDAGRCGSFRRKQENISRDG